MLQDGQNADLVHHISALLVRQTFQLDLLPHHQRVILHTIHQNQLDQLNLCMCLRGLRNWQMSRRNHSVTSHKTVVRTAIRVLTPIMCTFYRGTIESILTSCITVWYGTCNASCRKTLQRIVRAAEKIVGVSLPSLQDIYSTRLTRKALSIAGDPTHPTHSFFSLLPSGRRLRSLQARTNRLKDSFIHQAVRKLNSLPFLSVFERLLSVFNVNCMHQGSESNAISILCMYVRYMWKNWQ